MPVRTRHLAFLPALAALAFAGPAAAAGLPECGPGASSSARQVCGSERLQMRAATLESARRVAAHQIDPDLLQVWQTDWERRVRDPCGQDEACLRSVYRDRMVDLHQPCRLAATPAPPSAVPLAQSGEVLGRLCREDGDSGEDCLTADRLRDAGLPEQAPIDDPSVRAWLTQGPVTATLADVANTGSPQLLVDTISGDPACERVAVFAAAGGRWMRLTGAGYTFLGGTSDHCGQDLRAWELHGYHYLLEPQGTGNAVWLGLGDQLHLLCRQVPPPAPRPVDAPEGEQGALSDGEPAAESPAPAMATDETPSGNAGAVEPPADGGPRDAEPPAATAPAPQE